MRKVFAGALCALLACAPGKPGSESSAPEPAPAATPARTVAAVRRPPDATLPRSPDPLLPRPADLSRADGAAAHAEPSPGGDRIGVAACDDYLDKMARCMTRLGPEAQGPMREAIDTSRRGWQQSAKEPGGPAALAQTCRQTLDAARSAAAAMGCEW
jgi:hypothetical protein